MEDHVHGAQVDRKGWKLSSSPCNLLGTGISLKRGRAAEDGYSLASACVGETPDPMMRLAEREEAGGRVRARLRLIHLGSLVVWVF